MIIKAGKKQDIRPPRSPKETQTIRTRGNLQRWLRSVGCLRRTGALQQEERTARSHNGHIQRRRDPHRDRQSSVPKDCRGTRRCSNQDPRHRSIGLRGHHVNAQSNGHWQLEKPWNLQVDGDLNRLMLAVIICKGPFSLKFIKVKGHAKQADIDSGARTKERAAGKQRARPQMRGTRCTLMRPHTWQCGTT